MIPNLELVLNSRLIGQREVLGEISNQVDLAVNGFRYPNRPITSILGLGPTGVGKTECALIMCEHLFGDRDKYLARFDMSEYNTPAGTRRLLGGEDQGIFEVLYDQTEGKGLILWDEIEKAYTLVLDALLQMLSAARVTLSGGRVLDLSNYIIFCTSNIGGEMLVESKTTRRDKIKERVEKSALDTLRPEILNRFDLVASFNKLNDDSTEAITRIHVDKCLEIVRKLGHNVTVSDKCIQYIRRRGYSEKFGARPIEREAMKTIGKAIRDQGDEHVTGMIDYDVKSGICSVS